MFSVSKALSSSVNYNKQQSISKYSNTSLYVISAYVHIRKKEPTQFKMQYKHPRKKINMYIQ